MKKMILVLAALLSAASFAYARDVYVNGYYRNDGTYVAPHYRSAPNDTKYDNWTTKGNVNPYTGERGTREYDNYNNSRGYGYGHHQDRYDHHQRGYRW